MDEMDEGAGLIIALVFTLFLMAVITWPVLKRQVQLRQLSRIKQEALAILRRNKS